MLLKRKLNKNYIFSIGGKQMKSGYVHFKNEWDFSEVYKKILEIDPYLESFIENASKIKPMSSKEMVDNFYHKDKIIYSWIPNIISSALDMYEINNGNIELVDCINNLYISVSDFVNKFDRNPNSLATSIYRVLKITKQKKIYNFEDYSLNDITNCTYSFDNYIENIYMQKDIRELLFYAFDDYKLTEIEYKVLYLRFGLYDNKVRTLEEVGKIFNITKERIRQIEMHALRKLRHPSMTKFIIDYLEPANLYMHNKKLAESETVNLRDKRIKEFENFKNEYIKSLLSSFNDSLYNVSEKIYNCYEKEFFKADWDIINNKKDFARKYQLLFLGSFFGVYTGVECKDDDIKKAVVVEFLDNIPNKISELNLPRSTKEKFCYVFASEDPKISDICIYNYLHEGFHDFEILTDADIRIFWRSVFSKITL